MKRFFLVFFLPFFFLSARAQSGDDMQLAFSYYNSSEYEKASYLFESLFEKTKSKTYFIYYLNCLLNTENYDKAEKAVKKQISSQKNDPSYRIFYGYLFKRQNFIDKANTEYDAVLEQLKPDKNMILNCSNLFQSVSEYEYAEKTLLKGALLTGESYTSYLFSVYSASRNQKKLVQTGLDWVEEAPQSTVNVQNMFQYYVNNDINDEFYDILRTAVLQRIQKSPSTLMSEILIWLFLQKKNFKSAALQAKALDKRLGEQGQRLIILGDEALSAKDFEAASQCYSYVLDKGRDGQYYQRAVFGVLTSMYERVESGDITDSSEILSLERRYISTFDEFGLNNKIVNEIKNYSNLETYHLNSPEKAKALIEKSLEMPSLNYSQKAQLNLTLGEIELFSGDVWGATMTFAKVENDNKQNEYGDEAKLRKAKIAYYTGNFKWAASQVDVLKAATSKLVANDAMELSLLITDNSDSDTVLGIYARADMYFSQNQFAKAVLSLDSIIEKYPASGLVDESWFLKARISERSHDWRKAAEYYKKVADDYSYDVLADKAAFRFAEISSQRLSDTAKAREYYMKILTDYPGSVFAPDSREKYRKLQNE
jgi:tetratricopeptide (TPR) repeat protein